MTLRTALALFVGGVTLVSCRMYHRSAPANGRLPDIPVYEISTAEDSGVTVVRAPSRDPVSELGANKLISITASNADVRTLLLWLAEQSGVSLVVAPDVKARVSVSFTNVPAGEAIRQILAEAGLSVLASSPQSPWPPVVFYQPAVDINRASADAIVARFGVSPEMARWIVESRSKP